MDKRAVALIVIELGTFPKQIALGERASGWIEDEVDRWLRERIERSRGLHPS